MMAGNTTGDELDLAQSPSETEYEEGQGRSFPWVASSSEVDPPENEVSSSENRPDSTARQRVEQLIDNLGDNIPPEVRDTLLENLGKERVLHIMVCGLTGSGKSTILNGIVGKKVFTEGDTLSPETTTVQSHTMTEDNSTIIIYDTPGFGDASGRDNEYVHNVELMCSEVDVLLYCISVKPTRANLEKDILTLKKLKNALDDEVWGRCVIALTFANNIVLRSEQKQSKDVRDDFQKRIAEWRNKICYAMKEIGITCEIPMVPVGIASRPSLLKPSNVFRKPEYWLTSMWLAIYAKASLDGQIVLMLFNIDRITSEDSLNSDSFSCDTHEQPIVLIPSKSSLKDILTVGGTAAGFGGVAGVTGATIGAVIGALAIGIPSFGVAAGAGLVLGALIGGGAGVGVGAGAGVLGIKMRGMFRRTSDSTTSTEDSSS